jgi:two-component system nitrate/nitrite response regulator NarL
VTLLDGDAPLQPAAVLVADAHPMFRQSVALAIEQRPALELVGEAETGRAALRLVRDLQPDVALLDVGLADLGGIEVLEEVIAEGLATRVLFLTADEGQLTVYRSLTAGAAGFLTKNDAETEICAALELVGRGGAIISPSVHHALLDELHLRCGTPLLSDREREILHQLADGRTTAEIGKHLHLAEKTIKSVLSRTIYKKLGVRGAAAAVARALRDGWIQ